MKHSVSGEANTTQRSAAPGGAASTHASSALKKKAPKVSVQSVTGGTGTLMKRIQAEAANPGADLFWSGGFGTLAAFQGVMEPYASPEAKAIDPKFIGPKNAYVGTNVHVMVLMVNERQLKGLAMPTMLIWGKSEKLLPYESIDYFRAHLPPHAEVHEVAGYGHMPQMERPRDVVKRIVKFAQTRGLIE